MKGMRELRQALEKKQPTPHPPPPPNDDDDEKITEVVDEVLDDTFLAGGGGPFPPNDATVYSRDESCHNDTCH